MTELGTVVWITGLPGAGKTTIARHLAGLIRQRTDGVVLVDGDLLRAVMGDDLGYSAPERLENAWRVARLCRMLSGQGLSVVCATVSLFGVIHAWNRENLPRYVEVLVRVTPETLFARDQKGLYSRALAGEGAEVPGVDQAFELPARPDLVIDNDGAEPPERCAARILAHLAVP